MKAPYNSPAIDEMLAAEFQKRGIATSKSAHAIGRYALIGGLTDGSGTQLLAEDRETICYVAEQFAGAGLPVSARPRIQIYNLLPPAQCDFTALDQPDTNLAEHAADAVIASAIPLEGVKIKNESMPQMNFAYRNVEREAYGDQRYRHERLAVVSDRHDQKRLWENSAALTGAAFVVTRGGLSEEISITHFTEGGLFTPVIRTFEARPIPDAKMRMGRDPHIRGGIAFGVRENFLRQAAPGLKTESFLGEKLHEKAKKMNAEIAIPTLEMAANA